MIGSKTRWNIRKLNEEENQAAQSIQAALGLNPLAARLLVQRGCMTPETAHDFMGAGIESMHDPYLLKGMEEAAARIRKAAADGEKVLVYGDYDADGVSSTALMILLMRELGIRHDYYIPHRTREGYGMNIPAVDKAAREGFTLIVTVDNGISAVEPIAHARKLGLSVVVTDHHEPPDVLPDADAIVNPKQPGCAYPFKGLCGAGVAFKLAQCLLGRIPLEWSDIAALGTIADLMPLADENRIIVRSGLHVIRTSPRPGFAALAEAGGIKTEAVTASDIGFQMGPRVNAAGRLDHAAPAVVLLVTDNREEAEEIASSLDELNIERREVVADIAKEAEAMWQERCRRADEQGAPRPGVIVLAGAGWNPGVVGIVASKLLEKHYRPTVLLGLDEQSGMCKGSARSIPGYDLFEALSSCKELMEHYGGHAAAAGMTLHRTRLDELEEALCAQAELQLRSEDYIPVCDIDLVCPIEEASIETAGELALLEPYGSGNPVPKLLISVAGIGDVRLLGKEKTHLKLALSSGITPAKLDAIGFGMGEFADPLAASLRADIVGELTVNEWNGKRKPQLMIRDLRVREPRVYDFRGTRDPVGRLASIIERLRQEKRTAVIVTRERLHLSSALEIAAGSEGSGNPGWTHCLPEEVPAGGFSCQEIILYGSPSSCIRLEKALRLSHGLEALHLLYPADQKGSADWLERAGMGRLYAWIRKLSPLPAGQAGRRLAEAAGCPPERASLALEVFHQLGFIERRDEGWTAAEAPARRDLSESALYLEALEEEKIMSRLFSATEDIKSWIAGLPASSHHTELPA